MNDAEEQACYSETDTFLRRQEYDETKFNVKSTKAYDDAIAQRKYWPAFVNILLKIYSIIGNLLMFWIR